jgi:hypothetical protein
MKRARTARQKPSKSPSKIRPTKDDRGATKKVRSSTGSGRAMNLQQLREYARKTQGDIARKAAVTQPQLSRIEARSDHLVSTLRKYVRALGGDISVIAELGVERIVLLDV